MPVEQLNLGGADKDKVSRLLTEAARLVSSQGLSLDQAVHRVSSTMSAFRSQTLLSAALNVLKVTLGAQRNESLQATEDHRQLTIGDRLTAIAAASALLACSFI